jgi:hypothetical protein
MKMRNSLGAVVLFSLAALAACSRTTPIPYLQKQGTAAHMMVDGKPFLMLAGELHNSTTSSLDFVKTQWSQLAAMHLNTVLTPVYWELMEPKEGQFDFTLVDGQIRAAEDNNLRLAFVWFGSWKNGMSSYAPLWVKTAQDRFPLAQDKNGKSLEVMSTLSAANLDADSRAYAALMRHIKKVDSRRRVILMQVENEVGILGDSRDRSEAANKAFAEPVPKELLDYMTAQRDTLYPEFRAAWEAAGAKTSGTWEEVFGKAPYTDEIFMAWNYARYVGKVAAAGKAEYPIPMYVNTWLARSDRLPGTYPSGCPEPHVGDLWKVGAPAIDFRSPDMGGTVDIRDTVNWYHTPGNPLFIPEAFHYMGAQNIFYAVGQHDAMGFSPFGIDSLLFTLEPGVLEEVRRRFAPNADDFFFLAPFGTRKAPADLPLARSYAIIAQLTPLILENQGKGKMAGAIVIAEDPPQKIPLGNYVLEVSYTRPRLNRVPQTSQVVQQDNGFGQVTYTRRTPGGTPSAAAPAPAPVPAQYPDRAGALFINVGPDEYVVAGSGPVDVTFSPNSPGDPIAGIASIDEGTFVDGRWVPGRRLNGDESGSGKYVRLSGGVLPNGNIQRVKLYRHH